MDAVLNFTENSHSLTGKNRKIERFKRWMQLFYYYFLRFMRQARKIEIEREKRSGISKEI